MKKKNPLFKIYELKKSTDFFFHGEWKPRDPVVAYLYFQKAFKNFKYIICLSQEFFYKTEFYNFIKQNTMTTGKQNLKTWVYEQRNKQSTNNEFSMNILRICSVKNFNVTTKSSLFGPKVCNAE